MDREVLVPFFKAVVFADVMQVVASDDDGSLHLHFGHHTFTHRNRQHNECNSEPFVGSVGYTFVTWLHQCCH